MVKMNDFSKINPNEPLPWNVAEDLMIFMRNDPAFYRRHLYPSMIDVQEAVRDGGKFNKRKLVPIVDRAIESYVKKFNIKKRTEDLITDSEKLQLIDELLKAEVENFRKGTY